MNGEASLPTRSNVLLIAADDLRPEINAFGATQISSPNLDSLAAAGARFERAYCNVPVCGASRASILSGVRPTYNRFRHYYTQVDVEVPELTTLPEQFRENGYRTVAIGKVYHEPWDYAAQSWSEGPYTYSTDRLPYPEHSAGGAFPWGTVDTTDEAYFDGQYARIAGEQLRGFAESGEPFFLAVGFVKPHLPFTAPRRYWDLYDRDNIQLPDNPKLPEDAPAPLAAFNWGELRNYYGIPGKGPVSDSIARTLLHGYYASVSFVDAQIGKVLAELRRTGLDRNTLVVLWGDHGYNLGEHGFWAKHINMETAMRTTLLMAGPQVEAGVAEEVTELVDLYPTLLDYCGLPAPEHALAGERLQGVMGLGGQGVREEGEDYALSKYRDGITLIGRRYFYTEYHDAEGNITGRMLYDHETDPGEHVNLANRPAYRELVEELHGELWARLPEGYWEVEAVEYVGRG